MTPLLCLAVHCKGCRSVTGVQVLQTIMTWPLLHCVCWLPAVEVGLLTVIYKVHIATGCNNSNNNCMRQTQWLCQSHFGLGHKRQSGCQIRAGLGDYSLGHGWIQTTVCGPSCTRKGRTGWHEMMRILLQSQEKGRRRQANWNCSSRNLTTNSEAPPSKQTMKIQLLTTRMVNTGLYLESWWDSNKCARIFTSVAHLVRHTRCMEHIMFCGHRPVPQC